MALNEYRKNLINLTIEEQKIRDIYLADLGRGKIQGPPTGYATIDKPWLKYYTDEAILSDIPKMKYYDYLVECSKDDLDAVALNYKGVTYTYGQLLEKIDEVAKSYQAMRVNEGDTVTVCMPTLPETVFSFYALNKIGAVPDMIDPRASADQLKFYLNERKSKVILLYEDCLTKIHDIYSETSLEKAILASPATSFKKGNKKFYNLFIKKRYIKERALKDDAVEYVKYDEFITCGEKETEVRSTPYDENKEALIVHSSGTTSFPKGIVLSNDNVNSLAFQYKLSPLRLKRRDVFLSIIPAFAAFGMIASVHLPLILGMEAILEPKPTPKSIERIFIKLKPNHCLTVPRNYEILAKSKKIKDLSFFYSPGSGGDAPSKEEDINAFLEEKGCPSKLLKGWGLSEVSSTACLETMDCSRNESSGIPLVKMNVGVFDPDTGEELRYNERGEFCVFGPGVMLRYDNREDLTKKVKRYNSDVNRIVLHSGDLGKIDNDGCVFVDGRIERMIIKYDGKKIYPNTIEEAILKCPLVEMCCVVASNSNIGKIPKAYIVLKDEYLDRKEESLVLIQNLCRELLEERIIPDSFEIIDLLPSTSMGKVDYKKLEKRETKFLIKK